MRKYIWIITIFFCMTFASCKDSSEPFYSDNEQDRDDDEITGDDYIYHLPIIFHVLYQDANATDKSNNKTQYISYARLKAILGNVNDLYAGELYNFGKDKDFPSENIHIQFELAQYDENGKKLATPGVEYIKYSGDYPIDCNQFMTQKKGKDKIIWDPNEYINVMVYNFKQKDDDTSVTLGISNMPYQANGYPQIEGLETISTKTTPNKNSLSFEYCVSLNSLYAYSESTRYTDGKHGQEGYTYSSADVNVTLAHELGHFLGLYHVFAEKRSNDGTEPAESCDDTDYCSDTKSYNKPAYDIWLKNYIEEHRAENSMDMKDLIKRSNDEGEEWDSDNFMDYSICLSYRFTPEQKNRIRQVLYYSPLMPGPKKNRDALTQTRGLENEETIDLPIRLAIDKIPINTPQNANNRTK